MRADNTAHLQRATQNRAQRSRQRVHEILRVLDRTGAPVSVSSVANAAGVSRTYLYSHPDLLDAITTLRAARGDRPDPVPRRQRATETSLLQRIDALMAKNKQLRDETALLRRQLSVAHADLRDLRRAEAR